MDKVIDMDYGFLITAAIAILALIIPFVSLFRTRKINEKQLVFQEEEYRKNKLERQVLEREEEEKTKSDVSVYPYQAASGYWLGIVNSGNIPVTDVNIHIEPHKGKSSPLVPEECDEKLPISHMIPGDEIYLIVAISFDTGTSFTANLEWKTGNGENHHKELLLSI